MEDVQPHSSNTKLLALKHQLPDQPPQALDDPDDNCRCFARVTGAAFTGILPQWILTLPGNIELEGFTTTWQFAGPSGTLQSFPTPFFELPNAVANGFSLDLINELYFLTGQDFTLDMEVKCYIDHAGLDPNGNPSSVSSTEFEFSLSWSEGTLNDETSTFDLDGLTCVEETAGQTPTLTGL